MYEYDSYKFILFTSRQRYFIFVNVFIMYPFMYFWLVLNVEFTSKKVERALIEYSQWN